MKRQRTNNPQPRNENFKYKQADKEPRAAASSFRFTSCMAQKKLTSEIQEDTNWNMESLNKGSHAITMKSIENNTFRSSTELSTEDLQGERSTKMALVFSINLKDFQALLSHSSKIVLEPSCQWQILNHFHILVIQISLLQINWIRTKILRQNNLLINTKQPTTVFNPYSCLTGLPSTTNEYYWSLLSQ